MIKSYFPLMAILKHWSGSTYSKIIGFNEIIENSDEKTFTLLLGILIGLICLGSSVIFAV